MLSNSVAEALDMMNDPDVEKTVEFCRMFDRFFDCLNVSSLVEGKHSRNAFKAPYHSAKDFRIKVRIHIHVPCLEFIAVFMI